MPDDFARHLRAIAAEPRPAGGDAERRAREYCARELGALGFTTGEQPFAYSAFAGRWGTPMAGALWILTFSLATRLGVRGDRVGALAVLLAGLAAIALGGMWLMRRGVLDLPVARRAGVNLTARRGQPAVWLVAHLDSKSQPVSIRTRALSIMAVVVLSAATLLMIAAPRASAPAWLGLWLVGVAAAAPLVLCTVGADSAGALDNASGVATVLAAASLVSREVPLGVVLTSAEELGLAGARAWVKGADADSGSGLGASGSGDGGTGGAKGAAGRFVINCDGVDDSGALTAMYSGRRRPTRLLEGLARGAIARARHREAGAGAGGALAAGLVARRLLPGVLVDGVAFSDAGWEAITISQGSWRTLGRIHGRDDSLARLRGDGIGEAAALIAATAEALDRGG
jgi:hypothetical protein